MKISSLIFAVLMFLVSCSNKDKLTDKSKLSPYDYRLFQGTVVWPLAKAAHEGDIELTEEILTKCPGLANIQDSIYGNTILMMAIINQDYKLFKLLIDNGANVNYHNKFGGQSPLIEASSYKQYDYKFAKDLVEKGANVNDTTRNSPNAQVSPLMAASRSGNILIVEYLLKQGANINYRNNFGSTALGESMLTQKYDVALLLLNNGADFLSPIYNGLDEYGKSTVPISMITALRNAMTEIGTPEYVQKRKIIYFLKTKGINYDSIPIPDYVIKRAKEKYPSTWQDYLRHY